MRKRSHHTHGITIKPTIVIICFIVGQTQPSSNNLSRRAPVLSPHSPRHGHPSAASNCHWPESFTFIRIQDSPKLHYVAVTATHLTLPTATPLGRCGVAAAALTVRPNLRNH